MTLAVGSSQDRLPPAHKAPASSVSPQLPDAAVEASRLDNLGITPRAAVAAVDRGNLQRVGPESHYYLKACVVGDLFSLARLQTPYNRGVRSFLRELLEAPPDPRATFQAIHHENQKWAPHKVADLFVPPGGSQGERAQWGAKILALVSDPASRSALSPDNFGPAMSLVQELVRRDILPETAQTLFIGEQTKFHARRKFVAAYFATLGMTPENAANSAASMRGQVLPPVNPNSRVEPDGSCNVRFQDLQALLPRSNQTLSDPRTTLIVKPIEAFMTNEMLPNLARVACNALKGVVGFNEDRIRADFARFERIQM